MRIYSLAIIITISVFLLSCVSASYVAPDTSNPEISNYSRTIDKTFDETWSALVQYAGTTFFQIDNIERSSGLLTLSFGSSNPELFITGGDWSISGARNFDGDYVEYLSLYSDATLNGRMNIVVQSVSEESTRVTVNARYVFTSTDDTGTLSWSFDTGGSDTSRIRNPAMGTGNERTLMPTYRAELSILEAIEEI